MNAKEWADWMRLMGCELTIADAIDELKQSRDRLLELARDFFFGVPRPEYMRGKRKQ